MMSRNFVIAKNVHEQMYRPTPLEDIFRYIMIRLCLLFIGFHCNVQISNNK